MSRKLVAPAFTARSDRRLRAGNVVDIAEWLEFATAERATPSVPLSPELYWDRLQEQWPRDADGALTMTAAPLDLAAPIRA